MVNLVLSLLKAEGIDSVLDTCVIRYKELNWVRVSYSKKRKYYNASSFFTDAWVSITPTGPITDDKGSVAISCISDIARITEHTSYMSCMSEPKVNKDRLKALYNVFNENARVFMNDMLQCYSSYVYKTSFYFIPKPTIITVLHDNDGIFMGSFSVDMNNNISVLVCNNSEVYDIIYKLRTQFSCYKFLDSRTGGMYSE